MQKYFVTAKHSSLPQNTYLNHMFEAKDEIAAANIAEKQYCTWKKEYPEGLSILWASLSINQGEISYENLLPLYDITIYKDNTKKLNIESRNYLIFGEFALNALTKSYEKTKKISVVIRRLDKETPAEAVMNFLNCAKNPPAKPK